MFCWYLLSSLSCSEWSAEEATKKHLCSYDNHCYTQWFFCRVIWLSSSIYIELRLKYIRMNIILFMMSFMLCGGYALGTFVFDGGKLMYVLLVMGIVALVIGFVNVCRKKQAFASNDLETDSCWFYSSFFYQESCIFLKKYYYHTILYLYHMLCQLNNKR